jgi:ATP-dependent Clp protease protease subunit
MYNDSSIITLFGEIDDDMSYTIITQLLYLDTLNDSENIKLYINSPGGSIYAGNAIHDTIRNMNRKVDTIGMGMVASMASILLCSGTGDRKALPNTRIMIHGASGGVVGNFKDIQISLKEIEYNENVLVDLQVKYSNGKLTKDELLHLTDRDYYMGPEDAIKIGLIDSIV